MFGIIGLFLIAVSCDKPGNTNVVKPATITEKTTHDTDDPAIWVNPEDPNQSLIIGTDKNIDGALYVYDLDGNIIHDKTVHNLKRPNNVDVEYGIVLNNIETDIVVTTERITNEIRVYSLPEMKEVDNGGIEVFDVQSIGYILETVGY